MHLNWKEETEIMEIRHIWQKREGIANRLLLSLIMCSMLYILCFLPSEVDAQPDWQVTLRVEAGSGYNRLVLGADDTATDGYDDMWEVYAMLSGEIQVYFPHPEWNMSHEVFWRDIRTHAPGTTTEWLFVVESSLYDYEFTIKWDLSKVPESYSLVLIDDATGQEIDMRATASYSFFYTDARSFRVAVTVPSDIDAPKGLWATISGKSHVVTLHWLANTEDNIAGYNVYRSTVSGSGYERLNNSLIRAGKGRQVNYLDKGLEAGKTYYYVVTAVDTSGRESKYSNEVSVTK
jgi:hypothetical protein